MKKTIPDTKEIKVYQRKTNSIVIKATELTIKTEQDMTLAVDQLKEIKDAAGRIKELKEKYTKPANEILKNAREMFNPIEGKFREAEALIKGKMLAFNEIKQKQALKKTEKIAEQVRTGKLDIAEAGQKLEAIEPKNSYTGESGTIAYRTIKKVSITNLQLIPRQYLYPDTVKIKNDLLSGIKIPGAELIEEKIVASSR